jgi:hypothetical protein
MDRQFIQCLLSTLLCLCNSSGATKLDCWFIWRCLLNLAFMRCTKSSDACSDASLCTVRFRFFPFVSQFGPLKYWHVVFLHPWNLKMSTRTFLIIWLVFLIMLSWITKIILKQMTCEAMFAATSRKKFPWRGTCGGRFAMGLGSSTRHCWEPNPRLSASHVVTVFPRHQLDGRVQWFAESRSCLRHTFDEIFLSWGLCQELLLANPLPRVNRALPTVSVTQHTQWFP